MVLLQETSIKIERKTANKLKHTQTCTWIYENVFMHKQADPRRNNATIIAFSFYCKYT